MPRVHASQLTTSDFVQRFEAAKQPVIVEGLLDEWPAQREWQPSALLRRFADTRFKVGSDDDGYPVRMKLKHYLSYLLHPQHQNDDSPLYIFDGTFADKKCAPVLGKVRCGFHVLTSDLADLTRLSLPCLDCCTSPYTTRIPTPVPSPAPQRSHTEQHRRMNLM